MNNYSKARVALVGARGYAGAELAALLRRHAGVEPVAELASGREVAEAGRMTAQRPDFVFLATPPEASLAWVEALWETPARIIDLSGAYRLTPAPVFERWYGQAHTSPRGLAQAVYGWPEKNRDRIRKARLVANPGCYATAALTALWPLIAAGAIEPTGVICDAKSGASGAGRGLREDLHFVELEGNCKAYGAFTHRHTPEITAEADLTVGELTFTPHLLPTSRGILATTYVRLRRPHTDPGPVYAAAYADHPFVRLCGSELPTLHQVLRTNYCDLGWAVEPASGRAVIVSCLDNLVKGAAGQAVQNFNLMSGHPETMGLV